MTREVANKKPPAPTKKKLTPGSLGKSKNDENDLSAANTTGVSAVSSASVEDDSQEQQQVALRPKNTAGSSSNQEKKKQCKVLFSYSPGHEDELELKTDDIIDFLGKTYSYSIVVY